MASQEAAHLARFNALLAARRVRPTALQPLWDAAGFALGAALVLLALLLRDTRRDGIRGMAHLYYRLVATSALGVLRTRTARLGVSRSAR